MVEDLSKVKKEIGGYFALELPLHRNTFHEKGIYVNSGRNALELILRLIPNIKKVYLPYFTCDVVLEPLIKTGISYSFYHINLDLELAETVQLGKDEYIIYTDYYGIKDAYIHQLSKIYDDQLIVDYAQALYAEPTCNCFYSPRKFVGIPDGGIAYTNKDINIDDFEKDSSVDKCGHLLIRYDSNASEGYHVFRSNSKKIKEQPIRRISDLTYTLFSSIDFKEISNRRLSNFYYLHKRLNHNNLLKIDTWGSFICPMVYPYYSSNNELKKKLIENKIYIATYWPNVLEWCVSTDVEYQLADHVIALPIDQRYGKEDMDRIIKMIISDE